MTSLTKCSFLSVQEKICLEASAALKTCPVTKGSNGMSPIYTNSFFSTLHAILVDQCEHLCPLLPLTITDFLFLNQLASNLKSVTCQSLLPPSGIADLSVSLFGLSGTLTSGAETDPLSLRNSCVFFSCIPRLYSHNSGLPYVTWILG